MGLEIEYNDGQTPLDEEEKEGLLISSITTRGELDEAEQRNIEDALLWLTQRRKKFIPDEILTEEFVCNLHKRMLSGVWRWAGKFRTSEKNIGVKSYLIGTELRTLLEDCKYWIENETYPPEEIAIRLKHRIVVIHCFANGNGRHSRLMADVIIEKIFGKEAFGWASNNLVSVGQNRANYLNALRSADQNDYADLIEFAKS
ncbi:MAG: mobile mystery protein B [Mucilaginibacter sp.]